MIKNIARLGFYHAISPLPLALRRKLIYFRAYKAWPNLINPKTFSEKINWRIINDRRDLLSFTCDKEKMKTYVRSLNIDIKVPRTIWYGETVTKDIFPDETTRWILKPNHSSGQVVTGIGSNIDIIDIVDSTLGWMSDFNYSVLGEWAYGQADKNIMLEEMIGDGESELSDYKFYVFNGKVQLIHVDSNRFTSPRRRMYTPKWEPLHYHNAVALGAIESKPHDLEQMISHAESIGSGYDFIRVDLYRNDGLIWFGEMTPYPAGGAKPYKPKDIDMILGEHWVLPTLDVA